MFKCRTSWNSLQFQMRLNGLRAGLISADVPPDLGPPAGAPIDQIYSIANEVLCGRAWNVHKRASDFFVRGHAQGVCMVKFTGMLLGVVFSSMAFAEVDMEACKTVLSCDPYCLSHANSANTCKLIDGSELTFKTIKSCLTDMSEQFGGMSPQVQTLCTAGFVITGDSAQDSSDCESK